MLSGPERELGIRKEGREVEGKGGEKQRSGDGPGEDRKILVDLGVNDSEVANACKNSIPTCRSAWINTCMHACTGNGGGCLPTIPWARHSGKCACTTRLWHVSCVSRVLIQGSMRA